VVFGSDGSLGANGIANSKSQAKSGVDYVSLYRILGIGLPVTGTANDSAPIPTSPSIPMPPGSDTGVTG
jgi:hypothetical protein